MTDLRANILVEVAASTQNNARLGRAVQNRFMRFLFVKTWPSVSSRWEFGQKSLSPTCQYRYRPRCFKSLTDLS